MRRIAIASATGGTGKTTTAITLAHGMALSGQRVLVVDLDAQGHVGLHFGLQQDEGVAALLQGRKAHCVEVRESLWVLQSGGESMAAQERRMQDNLGSVGALRRALQCATEFDAMIVDCPSTSRLMQLHGLAACDEVILPVGTDHMSLIGARRFLELMQRLATRSQIQPRLLGLLPTLYDPDAESTGTFEAALRQEYNGRVLQSRIRLADDLRSAPGRHGSIFDSAPLSQSAVDFVALTQEIVDLAA
jgi:chromosome partitioning protein